MTRRFSPKRSSILLLTMLVVGAAVGQHWEFEQVDTGSAGWALRARRSGSSFHLGYISRHGEIALAHKDSLWQYETVDSMLVRAYERSDFTFAVGPDSEFSVSGVDTAYRPRVVVRTDTSWAIAWEHERLSHLDPLPRVAWVSTGRLMVGYAVNSYWRASPVVESWVDSVWVPDTATTFNPGSPFSCELVLSDIDCDEQGNPCLLYRYAWGLQPSEPPWVFSVGHGHLSQDTWRFVGLAGGEDIYVRGYDISADQADEPCAAYCCEDYLLVERDSVWPHRPIDAAVQVDSQGRRQVAFVTADGVLHFAYRDGWWRFVEVSGVDDAIACDLILDDADQPVIAFLRSDGSIWLAYGVDVLGTDEKQPIVRDAGRAATICRGVLVWSATTPSLRNVGDIALHSRVELLDAAGRLVMKLAPGPNDIRHLAPGIYFLRSAESGKRSAVQKIVIQR